MARTVVTYDAGTWDIAGVSPTTSPITVTDAALSTSNITTNNVSTTKHGFTPILPNDATKYLDGTGAYSVPPGTGGSGYLGYIDLQDQKTSGTQSGTFTTGAWRTRTINTEVADTHNDCSLASNQITLAAGTYECRIEALASFCDAHKARLQNVTDAATILLGTSEYANSTNSGASRSLIVGRFTIAASKALEVQHQCGTTRATNGFGTASSFSVTEIYLDATFWRVS